MRRVWSIVICAFTCAFSALAEGPTYIGSIKPHLASDYTFTDDPVTAGVTTVRILHLYELRSAINSVRQTAGLPQYSWGESSPQLTRAAHINEMRSAVTAAVVALKRPEPAWSEEVTQGVSIRARHLQEIRDVIRWEVMGTIDTNMTWSPDNSPYVVSGDVAVTNGATLTIKPGTVIKFAAGARLEVWGGSTMIADGTAEMPIVFTSLNDDSVAGDTNRDGSATQPAAGDWSALAFGTSTQRTYGSLTHAHVRYGTQLVVRHSAPALRYVSSKNMSGYGLYLESPTNSTYVVEFLTLADNQRNLWLQSVASATTIRNSSIRGGLNAGVNASANTAALLENNAIENNRDLAVYADGTSPMVLRYNSITNNRTSSGQSRGVQVACCTTVDARYNWWGSTTGPEVQGHSNSGGGGQVGSYVQYEQWLGRDWAGSFKMGDHPWTVKAGVGVDVATGNFFLSEADVSIDTVGFPLEIRRTYNNKISSSISSEIGLGWTWSYGTQIRNADPPYGVVWLRDDGVEMYFKRNADNTFSSEEGIYEKLTWQPATNTYRMRRKDQSVLVFDANGRLSQQIDANGNQTVITRDGSGRVTKVTEPLALRTLTFEYSGAYISKVTDPIGRTISYNRSNGLLTSVTKRDSVESIFATSTYTYANGNVWEMTEYLDPDGNELEQSFEQGTQRVAEQEYNDFEPITFEYRDDQYWTTVVDRHGLEHDFFFTASNKVFRYERERPLGDVYDVEGTWDYVSYLTSSHTDRDGTTISSYDWSTGNLTSLTEPGSRVTTYTYDQFNNVTSRRDNLNQVTTYAYDVQQNLIRETDAYNSVTQYEYYSTGLKRAAVDPRSNVTSFYYDDNGYPKAVANSLNETVRFEYDAAGRKTAETDPLGNRTVYSYNGRDQLLDITDPLGNRTSYTYDSYGRRRSVMDAEGHTTSYTYNFHNLLSKTTDAMGGTVRLSYDTDTGNLNAITDANGRETTFEYDHFDRKISETDPLNRDWLYEYVGLDRVSRVIDGMGRSTYRRYNSANQLVEVEYWNGTTATYTYDSVGNKKSLSDWTGTTIWVYDQLNRVINVNKGFPDTAYGYDAAGNLSWIRTENLKPVSYTYDAANRLKTVTDWANRTTTYTYDAAGRMTQCTYPNGVVGTRSYDAAGQLLRIAYTRNGTTLKSFDYTYAKNGNRTSVTDLLGQRTNYAYDAVNRLYWISYSNGDATLYGYDPAGNRTAETPYHNGTAGRTFYSSYDAAHQSIYDLRGNNSYNNNGQLIIAGSRSLYWNAQQRLSSYYDNAGRSVSWTYDGDGRRLTQDVNGGLHYEYIIDTRPALSRVLVESIGTMRKHHVYGLELLYTVENGTPHYVHTDGLGSIVLGTTSAGQSETSIEYHPFGALSAWSNGYATWPTHLFAGEQMDMVSASDYGSVLFLRARYMDTVTGRFLSRDPMPGNPMETQSLGPYTYAENNPVTMTDPTGECPICAIGLVALIGATAGVISQGVSDLLYHEPVRWRNYGAAAVGGAASAVTFSLTGNPLAAGAAGGAASGVVRESVAAIRGENHSFRKAAKNVAIETGTNALTARLRPYRIRGITSGRNSYVAIGKQMFTKTWNGTISNVAGGTWSKMIAGEFFESWRAHLWQSQIEWWTRPKPAY